MTLSPSFRVEEEIEEAEDAGDEGRADALRATRREDLLKRMAAAQRKVLQARSNKHVPVLASRGEVSEADVARVISSWTGGLSCVGSLTLDPSA